MAYLYHPAGGKLRPLENFWSEPKHGWIQMRYMPLNYEGDSSAYAWCEIFKIMRSADDLNNVHDYNPSFRGDLFPYCIGNNNEKLKAAREAVIAKNPGVEYYIRRWGTIPVVE